MSVNLILFLMVVPPYLKSQLSFAKGRFLSHIPLICQGDDLLQADWLRIISWLLLRFQIFTSDKLSRRSRAGRRGNKLHPALLIAKTINTRSPFLQLYELSKTE